MRIAIAGASGMIGRALAAACVDAGHSVLRLTRPGSHSGRQGWIEWDPERGKLDAGGLEGCAVIVNLAGASLAGKRWTPAAKHELVASRIASTRLLVQALPALSTPPGLLINASAVGYYGNRPSGVELDEDGPAGTGFLAELVQRWEETALSAGQYGTRAVLARFGVVLSMQGGMLAKLLPLFQSGLGGRLGDGKQVLSWVCLDDAVRAMMYAFDAGALCGPVNITAPHAVTNAEFARELGRVLKRPALMAVPSAMLRIVLGEMSQMLLEGQRVVPRKLRSLGFEFNFPQLDAALAHEIGTPAQ